jgi:hypothetical protein
LLTLVVVAEVFMMVGHLQVVKLRVLVEAAVLEMVQTDRLVITPAL